MLNRPESIWTAGALGLLSAVVVAANIGLASCESSSSVVRKRAPASGGPVASPVPAPVKPAVSTTSSAGSAPATLGDNPELRVRILTGASSVRLSSPGGLRIAVGSATSTTALPPAAPSDTQFSQPMSVALEPGAWLITSGGQQLRLSSSAPLVVSPMRDELGLSVNGQAFPGRLRLSAQITAAGRGFDGVEFIPLEEYLPGVVGKEMLPNWPMEAYRVQAVCARTYALHERERSRSAGQAFDLESSDRDQVYSGSSVSAQATEAVRSTRGQVIASDGKLLRAYYSSTCGGRTASARDTWPIGPGFEYNLAAPLQARTRSFACQPSPLYRWQVVRDRRELAARLRVFGDRNGLAVRGIKDVKGIDAIGFNEDGRPNKFRVTEPGPGNSSGRWYTLSGEELRLACNTNVSGNNSLPTGGAPGLTLAPDVSGAGPVLGAGAAVDGAAVSVPDIDRKSRVNSSDLEVKVSGSTVLISGRGFGHGVGMCQFCAKGFAERGENWRAMIERFYPGASIVSVGSLVRP